MNLQRDSIQLVLFTNHGQCRFFVILNIFFSRDYVLPRTLVCRRVPKFLFEFGREYRQDWKNNASLP